MPLDSAGRLLAYYLQIVILGDDGEEYADAAPPREQWPQTESLAGNAAAEVRS